MKRQNDAAAYNTMGLAYACKGWETSAADNFYQAGLMLSKLQKVERY
ncbi:MAG: hypothetical protein H8E33_04455 [Candidatus Cloacimonetes bacterium]|nr:hypothetical protein [Candidatus Cloacimonadota bacterium]